MATLSELTEQLTEVKTAISAVLTGGQEYTFNDGQVETAVKRGDLVQLYKMKKDLEFEIDSLNNPGGFYGS